MDVSITGAATLLTVIMLAVKVTAHLSKVNDQVEKLWLAVMGAGPQDPASFFYRFANIEQKVTELWERRHVPPSRQR